MSNTIDRFVKSFRYIWLFVLVAPVLFAQIFNLFAVLEQSQSSVSCLITQTDYLLLTFFESGRNSAILYMPFGIWSKINIIIIQTVLVAILLYEIHVIIANRKDKVKESLFRNHKNTMLMFFTILLSLYAIGDYYVSIEKPKALAQVETLHSLIAGREDFFLACSGSNDVKFGDTSKLISKE